MPNKRVYPSGLYNVLCGRNPLNKYIHGALGINAENVAEYPFGRYRDTTVTPDGKIVKIFTRNGKDYPEIDAAFAKHPFYRGISYSEYTTYEFDVPQFFEISLETSKERGLPPGSVVNLWETMLTRIVPTSSYDPMTKFREMIKKYPLQPSLETTADTPQHIRDYVTELRVAIPLAESTGEIQYASNEYGTIMIIPGQPIEGRPTIGFFDVDTNKERIKNARMLTVGLAR